MTSWHSYPKIYNLGHALLSDLFFDETVIQEKVDGSQFSFGIFNGELKARSKGVQLVIDAPEKMFNLAIQSVLARKDVLKDGWTYRAEYLQKPKHNALAYDRVPKDNLILFDINPSEEAYLSPAEVKAEAERIGLEFVPTFSFAKVNPIIEEFKAMIDRTSCLGGQKIEGVVVKNYKRFGPDKKALMGKYVSESFKEVHKAEWKKENPNSSEFFEVLVQSYRTPARWHKAVQHLKEKGALTNTPKDIGALILEVQSDISAECESEIKQALYDYMKGKLFRAVTGGLPQWYKEELLKLQFPR